jgi:hypothetical protein
MRGALVLWLAVATGGCGGESGPPENFPPFVASSDPSVGGIVVADQATPAIEVALADHDVKDVLFTRWLLDYPAEAGGRLLFTAELPPNGDLQRPRLRFAAACPAGLAPGPHRLMLSVADRAFLDAGHGESVSPDGPLDTVLPGGFRLRLVWLLDCR